MSEKIALLSRFSLKILAGQIILRILLRYPLWKLESLSLSSSNSPHHTTALHGTCMTQLLYSLILVFLLMYLNFQMFLRLMKVPLAFLNLALMSPSVPPSCQWIIALTSFSACGFQNSKSRSFA